MLLRATGAWSSPYIMGSQELVRVRRGGGKVILLGLSTRPKSGQRAQQAHWHVSLTTWEDFQQLALIRAAGFRWGMRDRDGETRGGEAADGWKELRKVTEVLWRRKTNRWMSKKKSGFSLKQTYCSSFQVKRAHGVLLPTCGRGFAWTKTYFLNIRVTLSWRGL